MLGTPYSNAPQARRKAKIDILPFCILVVLEKGGPGQSCGFFSDSPCLLQPSLL